MRVCVCVSVVCCGVCSEGLGRRVTRCDHVCLFVGWGGGGLSFHVSHYTFLLTVWVEREFKCDRYLATHSRYYIREMRIKAYTQLLESYRSVSLLHMAKSFGVGVEFMDR